MKLIIKDKIFEYENKVELIDDIMETIYKELEEIGEVLESLIVDEEEVFIDLGEYLFNNINNIEEIIVKSVTISKLIENNLVTTLEYIEGSISPIETLSNRLSRSIEESDISNISKLLEGIEWIIESFMYIDRDPNINSKVERKEEWNLYAKEVYRLGSFIPELLQAVGNRENRLISEILKENIIPTFNSMVDRIIGLIRID